VGKVPYARRFTDGEETLRVTTYEQRTFDGGVSAGAVELSR
jgi:hypothetical protein